MRERYITVPGACRGLKDLCIELGSSYSIKVFDYERVIYRDYGNGYEIEISRVNTNRKNAKGTIYIWEGKTSIVRAIRMVPREQIKQTVEQIEALMPVFEKKIWTMEEAKLCTGCTGEELIVIAQNRLEVMADSSHMTFQKEKLLEYTYR